MHKLEVGKPYINERTHWPEGVQFNWLDSGLLLELFFERPSAHEVEQVRRGPARFALAVREEIVWLLARCGDLAWIDAPYHHSLVPEDRRPNVSSTAMTATERWLLQVLLIDAATGILRVIRGVSLSPQFSDALRQAARHQILHPITRRDYDARVDRVFVAMTTDRLVEQAIVTCRGGE